MSDLSEEMGLLLVVSEVRGYFQQVNGQYRSLI
jgi:hypothetical protein